MSEQQPHQKWGAGTVFMNRYRLDSVLGQGGMGSVWKAEHLQLRSPVAIKMLDPAIANSEQMLARFLREAQACAALRSPHVVQIFDYGVDEGTGTAFIAMEMLNGEALSDRVNRLGRLPPEEAFKFLSEVLRAIGKAHDAGIVHRDLKPDNIFICRDDPEFAKVLDFGVAKVTNKDLGTSGGKTQTGMMIGTPYYMSPEQTQAKEVDHRADLWAIAVIAFEILTGQRPFTGDSFGELVIAICTNPVPLPSRIAPVPAGFDECAGPSAIATAAFRARRRWPRSSRASRPATRVVLRSYQGLRFSETAARRRSARP
jgi:serine/threonine protein kinase